MMSPNEIIAVVCAFRDGLAIESRYLNCEGISLGQWSDASDLDLWNFQRLEYRVKVPKREFWIVFTPDGRHLLHHVRQDIEALGSGYTQAMFREVLD